MTSQNSLPSHAISAKEFTILIAFLMSIVAITIDALLPALGVISKDIQLTNPNQAQYIISALFLGMSIGQLVCGPLSDATGRKKILYFGVLLFLLGTVICYFSQDLTSLLIGRFIQGLGVSGPYVSAISIVRDKYSGSEMAKVMSLVMMIFIMVPALAPTLGQTILLFSSWRSIFIFYMIYGIVITFWIFLRLDETLPKENRIPLSVRGFVDGFKEVISNRSTMAYTICMGLFFGSFVGYLNSSQQIFQGQFHAGKLFVVYFGVLALVFGIASLANSLFVEKLGMRFISDRSTLVIVFTSCLFLVLHIFVEITLWMFMIYAASLFFSFGLIFGNLNALAMEPMGHVAGIASAIIGSASSVLSMLIGTLIGQLYNNTLIPVASGFMVLGLVSWLIMKSVDKQKTENNVISMSTD
jgi:MFS transporter, DHA1 family, multidrug resistance protein